MLQTVVISKCRKVIVAEYKLFLNVGKLLLQNISCF
jgi:hypothetical protein